ncbi:PAS domain S-box protein [Candidatus Dojkabacteria bacterium]|uniref:histidine kinase n=1 Tax=Candidatus Dojkabacteria bacterium TaxID=2099670 RepID=A0A955RK53_9BACT|nr:PAS domain S-box protein [Candidatus Dojkabacteria bacterium]
MQTPIDPSKKIAAVFKTNPLFKLLFENSLMGMVVVDPNTLEYVRVNSAFAIMTGYSQKELLSLSFTDITHEEDIDLIYFNELITGKRLYYTRTKRYVKKNGKTLWARVTGHIIRNDEGIPELIISFVEDITTQRNVVTSLQRSEEQLRTIIDLVPHNLFAKDAQGNFILANKSTASDYGLSVDELLGRNQKEFINRQTRISEFLKEDQNVIQSQETKHFPRIFFKSIAGEESYRETIKVPYTDPKTLSCAVLCISIDVTEQTKAEEALRESEQRYRTLIDLLPIGVIIHKDDIPIYINREGLSILGYTNLDDFENANHADILPPEHAKIFQDRIEKMFEHGRPIPPVHIKVKRPDGSIIDVESASSPILYSGQRAIQSVFQDITERKKAEERLVRAKEFAEESERIKEELLTNVSHEIRTPLNAIIGIAEMLLETQLTSEQAEYTGAIKISADNLLIIINEILDMAKIESGTLTSESVEFSLEDIIEQLIQTFQYKIQQNDTLLSISIDENIPSILKGDAVKLRQVILNLLGNAVKFTKEGIISLEVELISHNTDSITVGLKVTDTGIGIPKEKLSMIFESFTQVDSGKNRLHGGTGLGLAIVKRLVEFMKGTITVKSTVGVGSEFYVELNFDYADITSSPYEDTGTSSPQIDDQFLHGKQCLIVEDNSFNQLILEGLLQKWGASVTVAGNGKKALAILKEQTYDILLIDIQMPEMDGLEVTRIIRQELKLDVPIIAISAHTQKQDKKRAKSLGMDAYITKPVDALKLRSILLKHLYSNEQN